jgi:DNA-binding beta-propeller fold protein YncE
MALPKQLSAQSTRACAKRVRIGICGLGLAVLLGSGIPAAAQEHVPPRTDPPLILTGTIALPNVDGRIDHFALDPGGRVFICVIGNDTVEVLETVTEKRVHTITGVPHPQGVVYVPEFKKLFVGSRDGKLHVFDGTSFDLLTSIDFHDDVDNLRYDEAAKRVYAAYGDGESAGIAMIDAATNQRLTDEFKLGAHPESFQLETSGPNIFANLPDLKQIAVINRATRTITRWPLVKLEGNFPMALDEANHRLFVGTRTPPRLVVLDTASGRVVAAIRSAADMDDLYYDSVFKRVYVPGGQGFISVFEQSDADHYPLLAEIPSAVGARTAGYAAKIGKKGRDRFYLAVPARPGHNSAEVWIYQAQE